MPQKQKPAPLATGPVLEDVSGGQRDISENSRLNTATQEVRELNFLTEADATALATRIRKFWSVHNKHPQLYVRQDKMGIWVVRSNMVGGLPR